MAARARLVDGGVVVARAAAGGERDAAGTGRQALAAARLQVGAVAHARATGVEPDAGARQALRAGRGVDEGRVGIAAVAGLQADDGVVGRTRSSYGLAAHGGLDAREIRAAHRAARDVEVARGGE